MTVFYILLMTTWLTIPSYETRQRKQSPKATAIYERQDSNLWWRKWQDLFRGLLLWSCTWRCCTSLWNLSTVSADSYHWTGWTCTSRTLWTLHHWLLPICVQLSSSPAQNARRFCQLRLYCYWHGCWSWCLCSRNTVSIFPRTTKLQCTDRLVTNLPFCTQI